MPLGPVSAFRFRPESSCLPRPRPNAPPVAFRLRPLLFVLLAGSALASIGLEPLLVRRVASGSLPATVLFGPVAVYAAFLLLYAVDRWLLVHQRRYPPGRAFFQIVFGLVFGLLLLPSTWLEWAEARPRDGLARHPDPRVRVVYVEALGFRGPEIDRLRSVVEAQSDADPAVRDAAQRVIRQWSGAEDAAGRQAWTEAFLRSGPATVDDP